MRNQIKKLELDKNFEIENLEKQLADWKLINDQLQAKCELKDMDIKAYMQLIKDTRAENKRITEESNKWQDCYNELKEMNLFQLILWWAKK